MPTTKIERIFEIIEDTRAFRFCGPGDDLDRQTAVCIGFRHLVIQLQRLASPLLPEPERERLNNLDVEIDNIFSVYEAHAELEVLLIDIETALNHVNSDALSVATPNQIIQPVVIDQLQEVSSSNFDTTFLVQLCKEINSCFSHGNIVATALTMRAVLNYVPPILGHTTFGQVLAHSGRSLKESFIHLQEGLRKISDLHAHRTIAKLDIYPSKSQIEPYKPQFEILLHEVLSKLTQNRSAK